MHLIAAVHCETIEVLVSITMRLDLQIDMNCSLDLQVEVRSVFLAIHFNACLPSY